MACWHPIKAYRSRERSSSGGYGITFNPHNALIEGSSFMLPCGRCTGCRLDRSEQWAMRCVHEAQMYGTRNCFITLTYSDESCPADYSVKVRDLQLFFKKLRKSLPQKVRYFACGEYGDNYNRPHYHALIFNHDFPDKKFWAQRRGNLYYKSDALSELWPQGHHEIGHLTYKSAAYTARYVMKKMTGDRADDHYYRLSPIDGQWHRVSPEFLVMSRRPGIGRTWLDKFKSDAFPSDYLVVEGKRHKPPRFYTQQLPDQQESGVLKPKEVNEKTKIMRARKRHALTTREDNTPERLAVREEVQQHRLNRLKREL